MAARRRSLTSEEARLWRLAMRDAKPLDPKAAAIFVEAEPLPPVANSEKAKVAAAVPPRLATPPPALTPNVGVDRRTDDRLRRGRLEIQARLDLHGLTQSEAFVALHGFIDKSRGSGRRSVLIITGKGPVSEGGGVLRRAVPRWLHEPPLREAVIAVRSAQPKDGGEGALYVLLRKAGRRAHPSRE